MQWSGSTIGGGGLGVKTSHLGHFKTDKMLKKPTVLRWKHDAYNKTKEKL